MSEDLIIPIYVDTNSLLDLLASIEGGFSTVEKITTQSAEIKSIDREVKSGTEFGVPNVLNLLKVNLGYVANWKRGSEEKQETATEKYHTYGSLFYRLREYLEDQSLIKRIDNEPTSWEAIQPSDFIELHGMFKPNPLANSLEIVDRLIEILELLSTEILAGVKPIQQKSNKSLTPQEREKIEEEKKKQQQTKTQMAQIEQIRKFLKGILLDIEKENIRAFVIDSTYTQHFKAVVLLTIDYLRDKTMKEVSYTENRMRTKLSDRHDERKSYGFIPISVYKEYHLLGKVVRKVEKDTDDSIDLLLGTGLGGVGGETLKQLIGSFDQMPGMNLPEINTKITGPALEIVPIAIFV